MSLEQRKLYEATEEKKIGFDSSQVAFKLYLKSGTFKKIIDVSNHT